MALTRRWIKLGRLFMVAWLSFFIYPVAALLTAGFDRRSQVTGLSILLLLALVWAWFWLRVVAGPDRAFAVPAMLVATGLLVVFTLRTPPQYGSLFLYAVLMAGAAFNWRRGVPTVLALSVLAGVVELARGETIANASGQFLNEVLVGVAAVAGRLMVEANSQLSAAREQIARLAVGEERLRFARDLHDLLGHSPDWPPTKLKTSNRLLVTRYAKFAKPWRAIASRPSAPSWSAPAKPWPPPGSSSGLKTSTRPFRRRSRPSWPGRCAKG